MKDQENERDWYSYNSIFFIYKFCLQIIHFYIMSSK